MLFKLLLPYLRFSLDSLDFLSRLMARTIFSYLPLGERFLLERSEWEMIFRASVPIRAHLWEVIIQTSLFL